METWQKVGLGLLGAVGIYKGKEYLDKKVQINDTAFVLPVDVATINGIAIPSNAVVPGMSVVGVLITAMPDEANNVKGNILINGNSIPSPVTFNQTKITSLVRNGKKIY